jgi:cyclopropane-fatty-acyl-phospholipid synthase
MSLFPLDRLLDRLITHGQLTIIGAKGERRTFGKAGTGPAATVRLNDPSFVRRVMMRPTLVIGEGYMDGSYAIEEGTLRDFLEIVVVSSDRREPSGFVGNVLSKSLGMVRRNDGERASRNVRHHYDIDHRLYEMFLDEDMQYSCAYWRDGVTSLEQAQRDKKEHIAKKLLLEPGMKVLDIGSGWGGLALTLARDYSITVTGVTLSTDQFETSQKRAREAGLADRVTFKLQDYRDETEAYDRIVSVGMFEHVGRRNFAEFFDHLNRLLKPDGVALLHTIGRMATPSGINAWMLKYIFPGAYLPSLSQLTPLVEERDMWLTDLELLRVHYSKTLAAWHERFQERRAEVAAMHDERFCRMWEFYLVLNEVAFFYRTLVVFQLQLTKQIGAVPLTRDYIYSEAAEAKQPEPLRVAAGSDAAAKAKPRRKKVPAEASGDDESPANERPRQRRTAGSAN